MLLILMPVMLLAGQEPFLAFWLPVTASFSMYPLLKKDGLCLAYAATLALWIFAQPTLPGLTENSNQVFLTAFRAQSTEHHGKNKMICDSKEFAQLFLSFQLCVWLFGMYGGPFLTLGHGSAGPQSW